MTHLVDIAMHAGNGSCSCEHFHYALGPIVRAGTRRGDRTRCQHIIVARRAFTDWMIQTLGKKLHEIEDGT